MDLADASAIVTSAASVRRLTQKDAKFIEINMWPDNTYICYSKLLSKPLLRACDFIERLEVEIRRHYEKGLQHQGNCGSAEHHSALNKARLLVVVPCLALAFLLVASSSNPALAQSKDDHQLGTPPTSVTRQAVGDAGGAASPEVMDFQDVPENSTFFDFIRSIYIVGIVTGYPCGGVGEPCGPDNLPYYRPEAYVTRGQMAKFADLARKQPGISIFTSTSTQPIFASTSNPDGTGITGLHAATTGTDPGLYGLTNSRDDNASAIYGLVNQPDPGNFSSAVRGVNAGQSSSGIGVWGQQYGSGFGVYGLVENGYGVYGEATGIGTGVRGLNNDPAGYAGYFEGNAHVEDGDLTKTYNNITSSAAPYAYGNINSGGSLGSVTGNVSASTYNAGANQYEITMSATNYTVGAFSTVVTPIGNGVPVIPLVNASGGKLIVRFHNLSGTLVQSAFTFVTYNP